jgi:cell division protein FtsN
MTKDYLKRRNKSSSRKFPAQFLLILASFLGGYLTASVFDFTSFTNWINKYVTSTPSNKLESHIAKKPEVPKPKFEFYTLLAKDNRTTPLPIKKNMVPEPSKAVENLESQNPSNIVLKKESYTVQIASFNKKQDAEHLKAALILKGYDVEVTTIQKNITWYRVTIGPFPSRIEAEKAQISVAQTEKMRGIIKKIA